MADARRSLADICSIELRSAGCCAVPARVPQIEHEPGPLTDMVLATRSLHITASLQGYIQVQRTSEVLPVSWPVKACNKKGCNATCPAICIVLEWPAAQFARCKGHSQEMAGAAVMSLTSSFSMTLPR